jgi:CB1 cannabinoid receptor-interacting protein 1
MLRYVILHGRCVVVQGTKLTVDEQQVTSESAVYRAEWVTTGLNKCKKGERQVLQLQMQVWANST